ncbi:hypothetical protein D5086_008580 [Populus alba]|uniref:Uncharacterized protein n=1 Tax=Populus alba TaxID=43335 RepID=A0ACC4CIB1_POPAL
MVMMGIRRLVMILNSKIRFLKMKKGYDKIEKSESMRVERIIPLEEHRHREEAIIHLDVTPLLRDPELRFWLGTEIIIGPNRKCRRTLQEGSGECKHNAEEKHINGCDDKAFEDPCSECISMVTKEGPGSRNGYIESRTDDI